MEPRTPYILSWTDRDTVQKTYDDIADVKLDAFVRTFIGKADKQEMWDKCRAVFDQDNNLMGICITTITKREPKIANLQLMHTFSKYRGKGIGRLLIEDSKDLADMENCKYFRVSAERTAVGFYAKCGIPFLGLQKSGTFLALFNLESPNDAPDSFIIDRVTKKSGKIFKSRCENPSKKEQEVIEQLGEKYTYSYSTFYPSISG